MNYSNDLCHYLFLILDFFSRMKHLTSSRIQAQIYKTERVKFIKVQSNCRKSVLRSIIFESEYLYLNKKKI